VSKIQQFLDFLSSKYHDTQSESMIAYRLFLKILQAALFLLFLPLGMAGCVEKPTPYRPPTMVIQATLPAPTALIPSVTPQLDDTSLPVSTPNCTDNLLFIEDLSLPDGTVVKPGALLDKRWMVENSGTCNWDKNYRLKFMSGTELNAPLDQALFPARSGSKATIRIVFTAPSEAGTYQSAWQAYNSQGQPFGEPIFMQVTVGSDEP